MTVRAKCGAGLRDREIGAGDDAERAVKRHGQNAAQGSERLPHFRMLHPISEVFVSRKAEPGASQRVTRAATNETNGARDTPISQMLAAPSKKAVQALAGGPGRSSAAT